MNYELINTLEDYYQAKRNKHALAIKVILDNPRGFHDHDAIYEAVESQLKLLVESNDYLEGLAYVRDYAEAQ